MPAARRLKRDLPIKDPAQAIELVWTERARVKLSPFAHHQAAQRIRPEVYALPVREFMTKFNVGFLRIYVPWVKALGLGVVFIDGDVEQQIETTQDLIGFIDGALKRRDRYMIEHIRQCVATGKPGGRAIKEMKMGRAQDIWLGSLMVHMEQLGFTAVLRAM